MESRNKLLARISHDAKARNKTTPRNDILGTLADYSNDLEPTRRNVIRVDDLPWLRHHKIQLLVLFPMTVFVSMAVKAASQWENWKDIQFDKFELREISVHSPLTIQDDDVEITLQLRPYLESTPHKHGMSSEFIHGQPINVGLSTVRVSFVSRRVRGNNGGEGLSRIIRSETLLTFATLDLDG
jgi:hypothetical protein